jgi:hypothetical protein
MKAWELLDSPEKWTQGTSARNVFGQPVPSTDPSAVCWCASGAIGCCYPTAYQPSGTFPIHARLANYLAKQPYRPESGTISLWNDDPRRTYEEVVAVLKELDI